jgi:metallo-beta-lactamase family protein
VLSGFPDEHRLSESDCHALETRVVHVDSVEESKALAQRRDPHIIVSASGMATGGRVLHHLKRLLPDPRHQVIFVGFQAPGTRGDALVHGTPYVKMHGEYVPVRATVHSIDTLSAHADQAELLAWLATAPRPPRQAFVTHGEPEASDALRLQIRDRLGWPVLVPEALEKFTLR